MHTREFDFNMRNKYNDVDGDGDGDGSSAASNLKCVCVWVGWWWRHLATPAPAAIVLNMHAPLARVDNDLIRAAIQTVNGEWFLQQTTIQPPNHPATHPASSTPASLTCIIDLWAMLLRSMIAICCSFVAAMRAMRRSNEKKYINSTPSAPR